MSKTFTFSKLGKMGTMDEKYGQTYWAEVNEQITPVKFNSMNPDIKDTDTIEAEEILLKTSGKGIEYHQLKKVKVVLPPEGQKMMEAQLADATKPPTPSQLDRIEQKLDKLLSLNSPPQDRMDAPIYDLPESEN